MTTIPATPEWQTIPAPGLTRWQTDARDIDRGMRWHDEMQDAARDERGAA